MSPPIVIYEDDAFTNLLPLTFIRPACRLRCGIVTLWEKIAAAYPAAECVIHTRPVLAAVTREELPGVRVNKFDATTMLLINGRLLAPGNLAELIPATGPSCAFVSRGLMVAARLSGVQCRRVAELLAAGPLPTDWPIGLDAVEVDAALIRYPWDLVRHNPAQIRSDFAWIAMGGKILGHVHRAAVLDGESNIYVAADAEVQAGAILLAGDGPIYVGPGAKVMAGACIQGPVAIGAHSLVKMQAKIYEGTTLGEYCKVGGEVEESIFQGYSNKQHDGFLGHSVLGEWINLGADTNNSDLKNNYGNVKVMIRHEMVDSGSQFVGATIGDHTKTGINTMINTGTVIGVGCNLFGADYLPKYVPSFCWGGSAGFEEYQFEPFAATAARVLLRRKRALSDAARAMLRSVHEVTTDERADVMH
ncbi:MAG: GlmU family protein [Phycisphaerae bacterium]